MPLSQPVRPMPWQTEEVTSSVVKWSALCWRRCQVRCDTRFSEKKPWKMDDLLGKSCINGHFIGKTIYQWGIESGISAGPGWESSHWTSGDSAGLLEKTILLTGALPTKIGTPVIPNQMSMDSNLKTWGGLSWVRGQDGRLALRWATTCTVLSQCWRFCQLFSAKTHP